MNQYAIYGSYFTGNSTGLAPVGTAANGAGRWGQLDLAGQIWEWNLDWKQTYVNPCMDCVNLTKATYRIVRGDNFGDPSGTWSPRFAAATSPPRAGTATSGSAAPGRPDSSAVGEIRGQKIRNSTPTTPRMANVGTL